MNKFELDRTMKVFGLPRDIYYEINGCKYYNDGRYFTIVEGKIPYELAKLIYEKYDNDKYLIRVDGLNEHNAPIHDVYVYHIDTIEGLAAFLLETEDYYSESKDHAEKLDQFLQKIYAKILEGANTKTSIHDWMLDRENRKEYFDQILNMRSSIDLKLRRKLTEFDNAINPFVENDVDFNNSEFVTSAYMDENANSFSLKDKESGTVMTTVKEKYGFTVKIHLPIDKDTKYYGITLYHYFFRGEEKFAHEVYCESGLNRVEYNITKNTFGEQYGEKKEATFQDKKFVLESLDKYISLANNMAAKNLGIEPTAKTFVKKQEN